MSEIVPVSIDFTKTTVDQFRLSQEFTDYHNAPERKDTFKFRDDIIFKNGKLGIAIDFGYCSPGGDEVPFKGRHISEIVFYSFSEGTVDQRWALNKHEIYAPVNRHKSIALLALDSLENLRAGDQKKKGGAPPSKNGFEIRWGRPPYDGEPPEGFLVNIFKPSPTDDGKVVINGCIFDPVRYPDLEEFIYEGEKTTIDGTGIASLKHLTRDEVAERALLPENGLGKILTIEAFFQKKLSSELMNLFSSKSKGYEVLVASHPKTGKKCLALQSCSGRKDRKLYILAEDESPQSFERFAGQVVLSNRPGTVYRHEVSGQER